MKTFEVMVECRKFITVQGEDAQEAEQTAWEMFDHAPFGEFTTNYILEVSDDSQDQ